MIGIFGEMYAGKIIYGTTDAEIFGDIENNIENPKNNDNDVLNSLDSFTNRDFFDIRELEEALVGGAV